jgi:hypothetical protein
MREVQVSRIGYQACQGCGEHATLRTLDVAVPAIPKTGKQPAVPAGWCPLIALCVELLRENATPDSSGAISP